MNENLIFKRETLSNSLKRVVADGDVIWYASIIDAYPELSGYTLYNKAEANWRQLIFDRSCNLLWPKPVDGTPATMHLKKSLESSILRYVDQLSIIEDSKGLRYAIMDTPINAIVISRIVDNVMKLSSGIQICINVGQ